MENVLAKKKLQIRMIQYKFIVILSCGIKIVH